MPGRSASVGNFHVLLEALIPDADVALVIGSGGSAIRDLEQTFRVSCAVTRKDLPLQHWQLVLIAGQYADAKEAFSRVSETVEEVGVTVLRVPIQRRLLGATPAVWEHIRAVSADTGVRIGYPSPGMGDDMVTLEGATEAVDAAFRAVVEGLDLHQSAARSSAMVQQAVRSRRGGGRSSSAPAEPHVPREENVHRIQFRAHQLARLRPLVGRIAAAAAATVKVVGVDVPVPPPIGSSFEEMHVEDLDNMPAPVMPLGSPTALEISGHDWHCISIACCIAQQVATGRTMDEVLQETDGFVTQATARALGSGWESCPQDLAARVRGVDADFFEELLDAVPTDGQHHLLGLLVAAALRCEMLGLAPAGDGGEQDLLVHVFSAFDLCAERVPHEGGVACLALVHIARGAANVGTGPALGMEEAQAAMRRVADVPLLDEDVAAKLLAEVEAGTYALPQTPAESAGGNAGAAQSAGKRGGGKKRSGERPRRARGGKGAAASTGQDEASSTGGAASTTSSGGAGRRPQSRRSKGKRRGGGSPSKGAKRAPAASGDGGGGGKAHKASKVKESYERVASEEYGENEVMQEAKVGSMKIKAPEQHLSSTWQLLVPIGVSCALGIVRIGMKKRPVARDALTAGLILTGLGHGSYMIFRNYGD